MMMRGVRWFWLGIAAIALVGTAYGQGVVGGVAKVFPMGSTLPRVQGVPFSADVVMERTQMLTDGNRIHQETYGKSYRDSQGRTRTEGELPLPRSDSAQVRHVDIMDPVQRTMAFLDPRTKRARVLVFPQRSSSDSKPVPATSTPTMRLPRRKPPTWERLGTKEMEGVRVVGWRTTITIEAGEVGNDKSLVTTHESWYSPELHMAIVSIEDDPRWGQITTRLTNIQREEPDPSLFQVPADYQIKNENRN